MSQDSSKRYTGFYQLGVKARLAEILDFGPEVAPEEESKNVNERLMKLIKALQDLNRRIDALSERT